jgi:hypothetical protein
MDGMSRTEREAEDGRNEMVQNAVLLDALENLIIFNPLYIREE